MPEADDVELGNHLIKKWPTGASECVVFQKRISVSCDRHSNLTCTTTMPLMGWGFVDYFG